MQNKLHSRNTFLNWFRFGRKKRNRSLGRTFNRSLRFEQCEDRRMLAPIVVTSPTDDGTGGLTLREAILQANSNPDPSEIVFASHLAGQVINITGSNLVITARVTITGFI